MDRWMLQRCASRSAAGGGADGLPRPVRDRVRCMRCTRVSTVDMLSTLRACEGGPHHVSTCVPQPLH
eukprot:1001485-Prymnesium_polylepis.1